MANRLAVFVSSPTYSGVSVGHILLRLMIVYITEITLYKEYVKHIERPHAEEYPVVTGGTKSKECVSIRTWCLFDCGFYLGNTDFLPAVAVTFVF